MKNKMENTNEENKKLFNRIDIRISFGNDRKDLVRFFKVTNEELLETLNNEYLMERFKITELDFTKEYFDGDEALTKTKFSYGGIKQTLKNIKRNHNKKSFLKPTVYLIKIEDWGKFNHKRINETIYTLNNNEVHVYVNLLKPKQMFFESEGKNKMIFIKVEEFELEESLISNKRKQIFYDAVEMFDTEETEDVLIQLKDTTKFNNIFIPIIKKEWKEFQETFDKELLEEYGTMVETKDRVEYTFN